MNAFTKRFEDNFDELLKTLHACTSEFPNAILLLTDIDFNNDNIILKVLADDDSTKISYLEDYFTDLFITSKVIHKLLRKNCYNLYRSKLFTTVFNSIEKKDNDTAIDNIKLVFKIEDTNTGDKTFNLIISL
ncbi:MAG: hypothetical protein [Bacteriophage sp.]|nr:MAG: hypothetical protein [Bacteriophage sp.]